MNLRSYGLDEGINEVIATTISDVEKPNAAPIGLIVKRGKVTARIYKNTATFKNLLETKALIANIVDDPLLFVKAAFSDLSKKQYCYKKNLKIPVLRQASAWILFNCRVIEDSDPAMVALYPEKGEIINKKVIAINRGLFAVIESTIHATRYKATGEERYRELIEHYRAIVQKCGRRRDRIAFAKLEKFMGE